MYSHAMPKKSEEDTAAVDTRESYSQQLRQQASELTEEERFDEASQVIRQIQQLTRLLQPV